MNLSFYHFVVVNTDLSGKELNRQEYMDKVVTSGSLGDVMVCTLAKNVRDLGANPALSAIFPIFIHSSTATIIKHIKNNCKVSCG